MSNIPYCKILAVGQGVAAAIVISGVALVLYMLIALYLTTGN